MSPIDLKITVQPSWMARARCRDADPEAFFPRAKGDQPDDAFAICDMCPVVDECLEYALVTGQRDGVWGRTTHRQRQRIGYRDRWAA